MTYEQIKPYIEKKLVSMQTHPENADVRIFNYTQKCQFEKAWDDVTMNCRGLILNIATGERLSNPFPKFFNYEEHVEKGLPVPPLTDAIITEKMDGSLGILYWLNGKWSVATRGSFTSEQAQWATEYFRKHIEPSVYLENDRTHLFEIIYPANKIVVTYDFSGLVYLGSRDIATGRLSYDIGIKGPKRTATDDIKKLKEAEISNAEGWVIHWPNEGLYLKLKFAEYVRLHKIVTGLSEIGIWEMLKDGKEPTFDNVPDEFFKWVDGVVKDLRKAYSDIETEAENEFAAIIRDLGTGWERSAYAERIKKMKYPGLGFMFLDHKDYSQAIWKMVRPKGQSVFKVDNN